MTTQEIQRRIERETHTVLLRRIRVGGALWAAGVVLVGMAEAFSTTPPPLSVHLVRLATLTPLLLLSLATRGQSRAHAVRIALLGVVSVCTLLVSVGVMRGPGSPRLHLYVALTLGTAALFPWGARAQLAAALVTAFAYLLNTVLTLGIDALGLADAFQLAVIIAASIYIAHELEAQRVAALEDRLSLEAGERALVLEAQASTALAEVGQDLISSLGTADLLKKVTRFTADAVGAETSRTFMRDPDDDTLVVVAGHGSTPEEWEALRVLRIPAAMGKDLITQLNRDGVVEVDLSTPAPAIPPALAASDGIKCVVAVALRRGDELIGILTAGHRVRRLLSPPQERLLRGIGHMGSLALENVRLFEELQTAYQLKSEFVATMSHELRTPLNIILGYGSLLRDGEFGRLNEEQAHIMQLLDQNAHQLLDLINATLDLSRLESGRLPIDWQDIDIADVATEVQSELQPVADGKLSVAFEIAVEPNIGALHTDRGKLKLIIKNLIGNAYKYTDAGSITLSVAGDETSLQFEVADTGVGIPPEVLPHIFEPFRQGSSGLSRTHGGVGLGLYIVSRLLELLGGSITVSSTPGEGTTFRFRLPRRIDFNHTRSGAPTATVLAAPVP